MTGPENYLRAERDIDLANTANGPEHAGYLLARAQVHATLALAAATALGACEHAVGGAAKAWREAMAS